MRGDHVFRVEARLHPEAAADIADQDPHALGRDPENLGELVAKSGRRLAAHRQREAPRRGIDGREHRARLDRAGRDALIDEVELHHVRRLRERLRRGPRIAVPHFARDVVDGAGNDAGRAGRERRVGVHHRRLRRVAHVDRLGRLAGLAYARGEDRRHGLAHVADDTDGERAARRRRGGRAVRAAEVRRQGERLHAGACEILAGEYREDARHRGSRRRVDRKNARVRMRRTQECERRLAVGIDVVGEAARSLQQRFILDAAHGLAAAEARVTRRRIRHEGSVGRGAASLQRRRRAPS